MNIIIFDLEATCWRGRPPKGVTEIIEIGAYKIDRYGKAISSFSKFIKPTVNPYLSGFCKSLTGINQNNVDTAYKFPQIIEEFWQWINVFEDEYLLCSWGSDDTNLLRNECTYHRLDVEWIKQYVDLKKEYRNLKNIKNAPGLKAVVKKEGFEFTGEHHRAISDAENLAKVFVKYQEDWDIGRFY